MSENDDDALHDSAHSSRRRFLGAGATVAALGLAGCSDLGGDGSGDGNGDATATATEAPALTSISYGTTAEGTLAADAGTDPATDGIATPVSFEGNEGDLVTATVLSTEFSGHLSLTGPDGSVVAESGSGNSIETGLATGGEHTLWAGSQAGDETGPFTLSLEKTGEDLVATEYGETAEGTLREGDGTVPELDRLGDPVTFSGSSGDIVSIRLESEDFDPLLALEGPDDSIVGTNDDGAGGLNSRLEATLSSDAQYTIWVTSFSGDATGSYTLSLEKTGEVEPAQQDLRSISYGESARGTIDSEDPAVPSSSAIGEPVTFQGSANDLVSINMQSRALDTLLVLQGPDGDIVGTDDDGGAERYNSLLETALSADGEYTIWATTFGGEGTGPYTLSLEKTGEVEPAPQDLRSISYGETARGTIDSEDPTVATTEYLGEPVAFQGSSGDEIAATVESRAFTGLLALADADGEILDSAAGRSGEPARLETSLTADAEFTLWVTSSRGEGTGPYTLSLEKTGESQPAQQDLRSISYGETARGTIDSDDGTAPRRDEPGEPVTFSGSGATP
ncbi:hypothetical protein [Halosegnis marinus]|uniref:hypothetical protein n=1 Tax=Halosegnis marinus TaxID=3034023 RepID=UPI00361E12BA